MNFNIHTDINMNIDINMSIDIHIIINFHIVYHIGCHTLNEDSEPFFKGTQKIEVELIKLCAEEILGGDKDAQDGYVAPGGTEANIQAIWIYRNYFQKKFDAKIEEIAVVYSQDSHYSMPKGANILNVSSIVLDVDSENRMILQEDMESKILAAKKDGVKYFIVVMNMSTTMFGSVDDIVRVTNFFEDNNLTYKAHVDGAFGGFIYPFTNDASSYTFQNERISSFTLDGHKMLQTPYGTGIFIIRNYQVNFFYVKIIYKQWCHFCTFYIICVINK